MDKAATPDEPQNKNEKNHGWVFEVPATTEPGLTKPVPLKAMGRFNHEAVAIDPRSGIVYLTEDRKLRGLLLDKGMRENLTLQALARFGGLLIDQKAEDAALTRAIREFDIRAGRRDVRVGNLSGGNQQKLLLAKTLLSEPQVILIDEPTRGIDIGTKQQIYTLISGLAAAGHAIIVISSEMPELIGLASRVLVMHAGRIVGGLEGDDVNEGAIVRLAMGLGETGKEAAA